MSEDDQEQLDNIEAAGMATAGHLPVLADQGGVEALISTSPGYSLVTYGIFWDYLTCFMAPSNGHCATVYTPVKAAKSVFLPLLISKLLAPRAVK